MNRKPPLYPGKMHKLNYFPHLDATYSPPVGNEVLIYILEIPNKNVFELERTLESLRDRFAISTIRTSFVRSSAEYSFSHDKYNDLVWIQPLFLSQTTASALDVEHTKQEDAVISLEIPVTLITQWRAEEEVLSSQFQFAIVEDTYIKGIEQNTIVDHYFIGEGRLSTFETTHDEVTLEVTEEVKPFGEN